MCANQICPDQLERGDIGDMCVQNPLHVLITTL